MSKPNLTRERIADMIQALDAAWIQAQENGWHQDERELLFQTRQLLAALTPPETLEECEAIVGEGKISRPEEWGRNGTYRVHGVTYYFNGDNDRLEVAQRAVVVKRLADAGAM